MMTIQQFLDTSYTAYHTTANAVKLLTDMGYEPLQLGEKWNLHIGGKYYVTRNGSSVIAFSVGKNKTFAICESHTDSPSLKIKGNELLLNKTANRLNVERYGGGLWHTFLDRQLVVAGRLLVQGENGVEQILTVSPYNVIIPSVAIHLNPSANENLTLNAQVDFAPLFGQNEQQLYASLTDKTVLDADLYVVPASGSFVAGVNGEFLCSPRLDNLTSVYSSLSALANLQSDNIAVVACLDNEEIGSGTVQGSPNFIEQVLQKIAVGLSMTEEQAFAARENGMVLSVDNGHAAHPAHLELADPEYRAYMNNGIVIKHHVNYSTDGLTAAILKNILNKASVAFQDLYNKSDVRCGSTLGLVTARTLGIKACDVGIAQLAMHSACETCGYGDVNTMTACISAFLTELGK